MSDKEAHWKQLLALLVLAPLVTGCGGASNLFQSDLLSKDAEWFSRPGRLFIKNVSIETPPLTPDKAVTAEDLVSADGGCPGMAPADANALSDGAAGAPDADVRIGGDEGHGKRGEAHQQQRHD